MLLMHALTIEVRTAFGALDTVFSSLWLLLLFDPFTMVA